eukprot:5122359-Prymnesium_polylepis.1
MFAGSTGPNHLIQLFKNRTSVHRGRWEQAVTNGTLRSAAFESASFPLIPGRRLSNRECTVAASSTTCLTSASSRDSTARLSTRVTCRARFEYTRTGPWNAAPLRTGAGLGCGRSGCCRPAFRGSDECGER